MQNNQENKELDEYPEHDKRSLILQSSHVIGEFLEHHLYQGHELCKFSSETEEFEPIRNSVNIEKLLADYFDIDLNKIDKEKELMLERLRAKNLTP